MEKKKGISLIVLVITIIVLTILATAVIITLFNTGIINSAHSTKAESEITQTMQNIKIEIIQELVNTGSWKITENRLNEICSNYGVLSGKGNNKIITTSKGLIIQVSELCPSEVIIKNSVRALQIFDKNGNDTEDPNYDEEKLHIGDFVKYNAGTWKSKEITQIQVGPINSLVTANGSTAEPSVNYQFGGFGEKTSKNNSVIGDYRTEYWRVFDVDETTGVTTLISAGCPEFYHHENYGNAAYISEYILTGNVNANAPASLNLSLDNYKIRNWDEYVNKKQNATGAKVLSISMLEEWFEKYTDTTLTYGSENAAYTALTGKQYETLIKLNENYVCAGAFNDQFLYCYYGKYDRLDNFGWDSRGIRICVELSASAKFSETPIEVMTLTAKSGETLQYNVWDLYE